MKLNNKFYGLIRCSGFGYGSKYKKKVVGQIENGCNRDIQMDRT